jgi:hypothetical protein
MNRYRGLVKKNGVHNIKNKSLEAHAPKPNEVLQRCILITLHMQVEDIEGVELCGTLKNIVAIAAGVTLNSILCDYIYCFLSEFNGLYVAKLTCRSCGWLGYGNQHKGCNSIIGHISKQNIIPMAVSSSDPFPLVFLGCNNEDWLAGNVCFL